MGTPTLGVCSHLGCLSRKARHGCLRSCPAPRCPTCSVCKHTGTPHRPSPPPQTQSFPPPTPQAAAPPPGSTCGSHTHTHPPATPHTCRHVSYMCTHCPPTRMCSRTALQRDEHSLRKRPLSALGPTRSMTRMSGVKTALRRERTWTCTECQSPHGDRCRWSSWEFRHADRAWGQQGTGSLVGGAWCPCPYREVIALCRAQIR